MSVNGVFAKWMFMGSLCVGLSRGPAVAPVAWAVVEAGVLACKGIVDTTHLIYYLSFITFGLFLTAKSVDSERWRG